MIGCDLCDMLRLPFPGSLSGDAPIECCPCMFGEAVLLRERNVQPAAALRLILLPVSADSGVTRHTNTPHIHFLYRNTVQFSSLSVTKLQSC